MNSHKIKQLFGPVERHLPGYMLRDYVGMFVVFRGQKVIVHANTYNEAKDRSLRLVPQGQDPTFYFRRKGFPVIYFIPPKGEPYIATGNDVVYKKVERNK